MLVKKSLIYNWAAALTNIAIKEKKVDMYVEQSSLIIDLLKNRDDFLSLLSVHTPQDATREKIISNVFSEKNFDKYIINALKLMVISDLAFNIRDIFKELRKKLSRHNHIQYGVIWSISELDDKLIKVFEQKVSKKVNKDIRLVNKIDKSLIGGIQIIVNGQNFDGSLKGRLDDIKNSIKNDLGSKTI